MYKLDSNGVNKPNLVNADHFKFGVTEIPRKHMPRPTPLQTLREEGVLSGKRWSSVTLVDFLCQITSFGRSTCPASLYDVDRMQTIVQDGTLLFKFTL